MRGWLVGLVIGLVVGAGGMYLGLRRPWGGEATASAPDGAIAAAPIDAAAKPKKKQGGRRYGTRSRRAPSSGGEVDETEPIELTAADRALEWRGDNVALPAQKLDMATVPGPHEARALEDSEINATVSGQTAGVRECVVASATGTDLRATITIKLVVDGNGRVGKSKLQAPHFLFGKGLLACAQRALSRMRFPATGAPTLVTFPVHLG